jgi:hypothetical protein
MGRGHYCLEATRSFPGDEFTKKTSVTASVLSPPHYHGVKAEEREEEEEEEEEMFDEGETVDEGDSRSSSGSHASQNTSNAVILKRKVDDCLAAESSAMVVDQSSFSKKPRSELPGIDAVMKDAVDEEEDTAASTSFRRENKSQELLNKGKSVVVAGCSNSREPTETAKPAALHQHHHPSWLSSRCLQLLANNNSHDQGEVPGLGSTSLDKIFSSSKEQRWRSKPPASSSNSSHCKLHNRDFSDCLLRHLKSPVQSCHCVKRILEDVLPHIGGK